MKKVLILFSFVLCVAPKMAAAGLPFIQDSYGTALSEAKQRKLPIFVECWAPW